MTEINPTAVPNRESVEHLALPGPAGELRLLAAGRERRAGRPPVLFVHGLAGRGEQWLSLLRHLAPRHPAAALTLRGHGSSGWRPGSAVDPEALAEDVLAAADALGWDHFVLVGHSLGGSAAVAAAGQAGKRVSGLLLVDPNGDLTQADAEQVETYLAAIRADPAGEVRFQYEHLLLDARPEVAEVILEELDVVPPEVLSGALEGAARYPVARVLRGYGGRKLSLITPLNNLPISLHKLVPRLDVELLMGTSHWPMLDDPASLAAYLDSFLMSLR